MCYSAHHKANRNRRHRATIRGVSSFDHGESAERYSPVRIQPVSIVCSFRRAQDGIQSAVHDVLPSGEPMADFLASWRVPQ
jgi:hypothetical protein